MDGAAIDRALSAFVRRAVNSPAGPGNSVDQALAAELEKLPDVVLTEPALAASRLRELANDVLSSLPLSPTKARLARAESLETFYLVHLADEMRVRYEGFADFIARLPDDDEAAGRWLRRQLRADRPVFPSEHSWLVPEEYVKGCGGAELAVRLEAPLSPPLIVYRIDGAMIPGVRKPGGLDAARGGHFQWSGAGRLAQFELIDGDVELSAILSVELRR